MATRKLEFSLRLRHDTASLSAISVQLGLSAHVGWDKDEQNLTLQGAPRQGTRESSYRSFALPIASCTELDEGVAECLKKLLPFDSVLRSFVTSGGMASLAVAWYSDTAVGGDRISAVTIAQMAQLSLTLDLYLYLTSEPAPTEQSTVAAGA
jgi:hypothetical protein